MGRFVSDDCEKGIHLIWFQHNPALFAQGIAYLQKAAQAGDPEAYYYLGRCYAWEEGGVEEDIENALELYKSGAQLGSPRCVLGANRIGDIPQSMRQVMKHPLRESFDLVLRDAQEGDLFSCFIIASVYFWGDATMIMEPKTPAQEQKIARQNEQEGVQWMLKAARGGITCAMRCLYDAYREGSHGVRKDKKEARRWLSRAAELGDARSLYLLGVRCEQDDKDMGAAADCYRKAIKAGEKDAYHRLGHAYRFGRGVNRDAEQAARLYEEGAKRGEPYAQMSLGECYLKGEGVGQDGAQAVYWLEKAVSSGQPRAALLLGQCRYEGRGCLQDYPAALRLFTDAADLGSAAAAYWLGEMYLQGQGVAKDIGRAGDYFQQSAKAGGKKAAAILTHFKRSLSGSWTYEP